jgi:hypothetical protein
VGYQCIFLTWLQAKFVPNPSLATRILEPCPVERIDGFRVHWLLFQTCLQVVNGPPSLCCQCRKLEMSPLWWSMVWAPSAIVVGTFYNEHFKRLPRSLQTGLVSKLMSSSRLHKMHISLHNLMWFLKQCNAWMIWYTIRNALLDTKLLFIVAWSKAAASPFVHSSCQCDHVSAIGSCIFLYFHISFGFLLETLMSEDLDSLKSICIGLEFDFFQWWKSL